MNRWSMSPHWSRPAHRAAVALLAACALVVAAAASASAHNPVLLDEQDTLAHLSGTPLVPDGTISFAFYGSTQRAGQTRAVRIRLERGEELHAELLVPDLAPENTLPQWRLPRLAIVSPSGRVELLPNDERVPFFEPFTQTSYLTLASRSRVAEAGTYTLLVVGLAPERFVAVTGTREEFTTDVQHATIASLADIQHWYSTPVPAGVSSSALIR